MNLFRLRVNAFGEIDNAFDFNIDYCIMVETQNINAITWQCSFCVYSYISINAKTLVLRRLRE